MRAESGADALDTLKQLKLRGETVATLIADYRMPQMTGIEFLEQAMDLYPAARRVLLTAYADSHAAIDAINVVDLDHYLLKPWDPPEEKLYPVIDALLDAWKRAPEHPIPHTKVIGHRWSARSWQVRDFLARNGLYYTWFMADEPDGERLLQGRRRGRPAAPGRRHRTRRPARRTHRRRTGRHAGPDHHPVAGVLRPGRHRRRARGPGRRRLRRLRGAAHGAHRTHRDRRSGRPELADRELPGLSGRGVGRPAGRPRAPAGGEVRRRADHRPHGHRAGSQRESKRTVRFADGGSIDAHAVILATGVAYRQLDGDRVRPS